MGELLPTALSTASIPIRSSGQDSETYELIQLTEAEKSEALREAREKKFYRLQEQEREARVAEFRRQLTEQWSPAKTKAWIEKRVNVLFPGETISFEDLENRDGQVISNAGSVFTLLCLYFSNDPLFIEKAELVGVKRPDLRKGLMLAGAVGCGKTTLMQLFQRNQRQVFMIKHAREISRRWRELDKDGIGQEYLEKMAQPYALPAEDVNNFYHRFAGLCIDDMGTEEVQNSFGNKASVIGDIIEARYANGAMGPMLHITTNLTGEDLKNYYGSRVTSRIRETMNIIDYLGEDRR